MPITNIVCSGSFHQLVDLEQLSRKPDLEVIYNPKKYHGAYLVIKTRKVIIYKSGKYIIAGLKHIEDVPRFYTLIKSALDDILDISLFEPPVIQNIVMIETLDSPVNLISMIENNPNLVCEYEPEQFPGLICKRPEGTILLFSTGKMILTGLKKVEDKEKLIFFIQSIV